MQASPPIRHCLAGRNPVHPSPHPGLRPAPQSRTSASVQSFARIRVETPGCRLSLRAANGIARSPAHPQSPTPVPPSNRPLRHTYNPLFSNAFCVCQIDTVLHYSLRTESRTESKCHRNRQISGTPQRPWHTQNRPEPRVARGKPRSDKANREQLALNSGGGVRAGFKLVLTTDEYCCGLKRDCAGTPLSLHEIGI